MIEIEAPRTSKEKDAAIELAISALDKTYGEGTVVSMKNRVGKPVPHIPTGIWEVDTKVLGVGGFPRGRIVEVYGSEAGGKTSLALRTVGSAQRAGGRAAFIDAEHALDVNWASKMGVSVDDLLVCQPDFGEQALEVVGGLVETRAVDIIVVDSVSALVPKAEIEGDMGDSHMALQARLMSQAMRKLTHCVSQANCVLLFINQIRSNLGVTYGTTETTTGGRALRFYASVRLDVRRIGAVKSGETVIGNKVRIKGAKNKVATPFREVEIELLFDRGFDAVGSLIDAAVEKGVVSKSGSWYSYKGERAGQGKEAARDYFKDKEEELRAALSGVNSVPA